MKILAWFLFVPTFACAASQSIECPHSLDVSASATPPNGWTLASTPGGNVLERFSVYSGHPSERAALVPDQAKAANGQSQDQWSFAAGTTETLWAACHYTGTSLFIARPLEPGIGSCTAKYKTLRSGARVGLTEIDCH